jgi:hypothetical protein
MESSLDREKSERHRPSQHLSNLLFTNPAVKGRIGPVYIRRRFGSAGFSMRAERQSFCRKQSLGRCSSSDAAASEADEADS